MPQVKLFGLVLIITTLLLGMVVVVTGTFEIQLHDPSARPPIVEPSNMNNPDFPDSRQPSGGWDPNLDNGPMENTMVPYEPQFVSIPVVIPLGIAGALGMLLWFAPGSPNSKTRAGMNRSSTNRSSTKYRRTRKR